MCTRRSVGWSVRPSVTFSRLFAQLRSVTSFSQLFPSTFFFFFFLPKPTNGPSWGITQPPSFHERPRTNLRRNSATPFPSPPSFYERPRTNLRRNSATPFPSPPSFHERPPHEKPLPKYHFIYIHYRRPKLVRASPKIWETAMIEAVGTSWNLDIFCPRNIFKYFSTCCPLHML